MDAAITFSLTTTSCPTRSKSPAPLLTVYSAMDAAMDAAITSRIGFKGSRVEGFIGSWVHGLMSSRIHWFVGSWVHGFMSSRVQGFKGLTC